MMWNYSGFEGTRAKVLAPFSTFCFFLCSILDPRALLFCACMASSDAVKRGLWGRERLWSKCIRMRVSVHAGVVISGIGLEYRWRLLDFFSFFLPEVSLVILSVSLFFSLQDETI